MKQAQLTPDDLIALARERGVHPLFAPRLRELAEHAYTTHGHPHGDRKVAPFTAARIARGWPARGSITLTRADGARFALRLRGDRWRVDRLGSS